MSYDSGPVGCLEEFLQPSWCKAFGPDPRLRCFGGGRSIGTSARGRGDGPPVQNSSAQDGSGSSQSSSPQNGLHDGYDIPLGLEKTSAPSKCLLNLYAYCLLFWGLMSGQLNVRCLLPLVSVTHAHEAHFGWPARSSSVTERTPGSAS